MKISINELRSIFDILEKEVRLHCGEEVEIESEDYYWEIKEDELYNPTTPPNDLMLGQISDDWMELSRLVNPSEIPVSYDLKRLGAVLEAVRVNSQNKW